MTRAAFAAADWGTTRLRVWLIDDTGAPVAERRSDEGLLSVGGAGFEAVFERILGELGAPTDLPAIVCGMAGSRQGWLEVPYVDVPAKLEDVLSRAVRVPSVRRQVMILPGAALRQQGRPDVMRGEETQLAGVAALLGEGNRLACMPGTHSKWVELRDGTLTDFTTWMTGELYSVLAGHSILAHSLGKAPGAVDPETPAFGAWLGKGLANPQDVTAKLFKIRAGGLLFGLQPDDAAAALSGLLIGVEIASARRTHGGGEVVLVVSGALGALYQMALTLAGYRVRTVDADETVRLGLTAAASRLLDAGGSR
ncbi:MAG: 2-dehydro-3-deoxygalactonokinase [Rhizobiaceae bacterium]|nr:2-dehydro-3-deoxygalactonokinase [Rhizobiaceae bacterium]